MKETFFNVQEYTLYTILGLAIFLKTAVFNYQYKANKNHD